MATNVTRPIVSVICGTTRIILGMCSITMKRRGLNLLYPVFSCNDQQWPPMWYALLCLLCVALQGSFWVCTQLQWNIVNQIYGTPSSVVMTTNGYQCDTPYCVCYLWHYGDHSRYVVIEWKRRYNETPSPISWVHSQNYPRRFNRTKTRCTWSILFRKKAFIKS